MKQKMRFTIWMMAVFTILTGCTGTRYEYPYLNPNLSIEERVDDLVSRMTLEQKVSQMVADSKAIDSLHVPAYHWWNECLHGVGRAGIATVFPQAIGLGATWDTSLIYQVADVISTEARAKHHEFARNNKRGIYQGLTFWSPNINIFRDPRWGRGQETYGEDPYLTGRIGVKFVEGLQGNDPKYFKVIATAKHYAVHSGPEPLRHVFDARVSDQDLWETYLPAFEDLMTEAKAYSIMGAYNAFRGEACNASRLLLDSILRQKWNFQGYVVSDCGAIDDIYLNHKHVATQPEAAALAVKRGCDLNCENAYLSLTEAVKKGFITEKEIDVAVKRLFTARFKLGMFDPQEMVPYAKIPISKNDAPEHRELAKKTAEASMVLLKNEGNLLPLDKSKIKTVAVVGPNANDIDVLYGNYNGFASKPVTILDGNLALKYLWARNKIMLLDDYGKVPGDFESVKKEVLALGLKYNLLTAYTSFIAIDSDVRNNTGKSVTVKQPLPLPEGVNNNAVGFIAGKQTFGSVARRSPMKVMNAPQPETFFDSKKEEVDEDRTWTIVEEPATFQGGDIVTFQKWIQENLKYPVVEGSVYGKVYVQFTVNKEGEIEDIRILRGVDPLLDNEVVRVLKTSPKWQPAKQDGKTVKQLFTIPVEFKLN